MGFTAGYVTSNTKVRFNTYGGMMTGNTVSLGISIYQQNWAWAGVYASLLGMFALGTLFALIMIEKLGKQATIVTLVVFCSSFVVIDGVALLLDHDALAGLLSSLAAFALGAQNLQSQKSGVIKGNTTFMTGNVQKMTEAVYRNLSTGLKASEKRAAILLLYTWIMYVLGGISGASLAKRFDWSLTPVAVTYVIGMYSMQVELAESPPPKPPPAVNSTKEDPPLPPVLAVERQPGC